MDLNNASTHKLLALRQAAQQTALSEVHLRRLVRAGRIAGIRLGRYWYTTAEAVHAYQAEGHRPGPKPKHCKTNPTSTSEK